jgi:uncharacterized membrane protein YeaQ/YmgE (transglycosylase-associated protein family)
MHEHVGSEPSGADFGVIAGWLAGLTVQGAGFGIIGDLMIGIVGAFIGSWLLPKLVSVAKRLFLCRGMPFPQ